MTSDYKAAQNFLLGRNSLLAFDLLDWHGYIHTGITPADSVARHSAPFFALKGPDERCYPTIVVCNTPDDVTKSIRAELRRLLPHFSGGIRVDKLDALNLTNESKAHSGTYHPGHVIDVHQSSFGLKKDDSYTVSSVERPGSVRLSNGSLLPLNMPDTFTVRQRLPGGFELCVGDLVRLPQECPNTPQNTDLRFTFRVVSLAGGFVFLTEAWPPASANDVSLNVLSKQLLVLPMTYGRFTYAFCQTPLIPLETTYDYIFNVHEMWTPHMIQQFRDCVLHARTHSVSFTHPEAFLRDSLLIAEQEEIYRTHNRSDTALQEPERATKAQSISREPTGSIKREFDHER